MAMAKKDIHTQSGKSLDGIVRRDLCAHTAYSPHNIGKFHFWRRSLNAELWRFNYCVRCSGRANQGLRWYAAIVEAIAAREVAFDKSDPRSQNSRAGRRPQSCRPRSNNDKVVAPCRLRIDPVRRMSVVHQLLVEFVRGFHL